MTRSTVFKTNVTQAIRIPKDLAYPDSVKEVEITRHGDVLTVVPKYRDWRDWFERGPRLPDDFPAEIEDRPPEPVEPFDA